MKKILKAALPILLSATAVVGMSSCSVGKASLLREPIVVSAAENKDEYKEILSPLKTFAARLGEECLSTVDENAVISPVSVYMALALASGCAGGNTKSELLNVLGADEDSLKGSIPSLYSTLNQTFTSENKEQGKVILTNSVWYDSRIDSLKSDCLDELSDYYKAYSYQADFFADNAAANNAVRNFIKERTNNLLDCDWELGEKTLLALINTLYMKDVWSTTKEELSSCGKVDFLNGDGTKKNATFYSAFYRSGKTAKAENCEYFYAMTSSGFNITFVKPNDGVKVSSVLNEENLEQILSGKYESKNEEKHEMYETRCIFPEFSLYTNKDIAQNLKNMGINSLFNSSCDFSSVTDESVYCEKVQHAAKLNVDKNGVEGAAVTIIQGEATACGPDEYTTVYENFILDRSFGVVVSYQNIPLFVGAVNSL